MLSLKWIGMILIIAGCGGIGQYMAYSYRQELRSMQQLSRALLHIQCELETRLSPLPDIFRQLGKKGNGRIYRFFDALSGEMERQISPDAPCCVEAVLSRMEKIPESIRKYLREFGDSLGEFDCPGQIRQLIALRQNCDRELEMLSNQKEDRIRGYQTLGLCAGAALAVLLL